MSARAGTRAAGYSKGLILAILVDRKELSLRELVLCFLSCKAFRELLDGRGFCIGTAWLCASLENGRSPTEILSRLGSARRSVAYERPLSRVDQVTSFLKRFEDHRMRWKWEWAQLLYQEPDGGVLCEGVKKMFWLFKRRLVTELHKSSWYYRGLCTLTGHSNVVSSIAWSPCGNFVASGSWDSTIKVWEVEAGSDKCSLKGHDCPVLSVAFSPNGKSVASSSGDIFGIGGTNCVKIWNLDDMTEVCTLTGHSGMVLSLAWSPDGKTVASGSSDSTVRLWDVETGSEKCSLTGHSKTGCFSSLIRSFTRCFSCFSDPRLKCTLTGHSGSVSSVAWSPCGKFVASGSYDETIKIWDVEAGSEKCSLTGHSDWVFSVAWSPDGTQIASSSRDKTVRIWDVSTGKEAMGPLTGHSTLGFTVAWSPDGKLVASGSCDATVRIWDVSTGKEAMGPLTGLKGHSSNVASVAWSPDGKVVASGSWDKTIRIWDVASGKEALGHLTGHSPGVLSVAWTPDGKLVASSSSDRTTRIWDVAAGKEAMGPHGLASMRPSHAV